MSRHLSRLRLTRMVSTRREGTQVFYTPASDHLARMVLDVVEQAAAAVAAVAGVRSVDELLIRWIRHTLRTEASVTIDPDLTPTAAHDIAHHAEDTYSPTSAG